MKINEKDEQQHVRRVEVSAEVKLPLSFDLSTQQLEQSRPRAVQPRVLRSLFKSKDLLNSLLNWRL